MNTTIPRVPLSLVTFCLVVATGASRLQADAWRLTMESGDHTNVWLVDEQLGVKMHTSAQPDLEIILRADQKATLFINQKLNAFAVQPWNAGGLAGGTPIQNPRAAQALQQAQAKLQQLDPRARAAAERQLTRRFGGVTDGRASSVVRQYRPTGQVKKIDRFDTKEIAELANGQPTGRTFWVTPMRGWEKLATTMQLAMNNFGMIPLEKRIPFKELDGLPIEMNEPDGTVSRLSDIKPVKINPAEMQPQPQMQQVELLQLMQQ